MEKTNSYPKLKIAIIHPDLGIEFYTHIHTTLPHTLHRPPTNTHLPSPPQTLMGWIIIARYLMDEVKDKNAKQIDTSSWKQEVVDNLPLQKNGWDCGMFMLKYADFYSRGLSLSFKQCSVHYKLS
ncbi:Ubiquitin-like-specific protease 1A [Ananas comosus]|uniref:Ubiquitin-like-specific protease 1A n=1 Tax=Ananas comosus TaxID=4615 RepID=A0A199VVH5_ANACO|nr:Ubiquitin-like-specific protease 1A [Ananas comosus]